MCLGILIRYLIYGYKKINEFEFFSRLYLVEIMKKWYHY